MKIFPLIFWLLSVSLQAQDVTIPQSAAAIIAETSKMKAALKALPAVNSVLTLTGTPTMTSASPDLTLTWSIAARSAATNVIAWVSLPPQTTYGAIVTDGMVGFTQGNLAANDARTISVVLHLLPGIQASAMPITATATWDGGPPITSVTTVTTTMTDAQLISGAVNDLRTTSAAVVVALAKP